MLAWTLGKQLKKSNHAIGWHKLSIEANSVDPEQEPSDLDLHYLSKRLQIFQQTIKAYDFKHI